MRYAMSTVIIVGEFGLIMSGTESTESIVTNDRTRPTSSVPRTCGSTMANSTRSRTPGHAEVTEGGLLPHERHHDAAPVEQALRCEWLNQSGTDQHVIEHPVLRKERAHDLAGDDERDEQRPAIEPAQRRHGARVFAQRQVARDRDGDEPDQDRRQEHDADGEQEIRPVEVPGLDEVLEREIAVLASKGEHARKNQRQYEKSENHPERRGDKRVRLPVPGRASGFSHD